MKKGEQTRETIVARAAALFNQRGYAGVSMSDIMAATGLKKGGIYNHFDSKEDLALVVFDYAIRQVRRRFVQALLGKETAVERLHAVLHVMQRYVVDPPVPGGCPVQNTAIDSDDAYPALRARARQGMDELQDYIRHTVAQGIEQGELHDAIDPHQVASVILATLEGALMLSKLYDDPMHMDRAVAHLSDYIEHRLRKEQA